MTALCDWVALFAFFGAFIILLTNNGRHALTLVALGLTAWALPIALTASHVIK